jgi:hypothetical protein
MIGEEFFTMQGDEIVVNYTAEQINDPILVWKKIFNNFSMQFECMLPAIVQKYDRQKNIVSIQCAISHTTVTGEVIDRVLMQVPCFNPAGSSVGINFPLQKGDTGWVIACDRDTSLFMKELKKSQANTSIFHKFHFGFFIPDKIKGFQIGSEDEGALVIQTLDGTSKISIKGGQITVTSTNNVNVNAVNVDLQATNVNLTASNTVCTTNATFNGNITVNGTITSTTDFIVGDVSLMTHAHTSSVAGSPTSPPIQQQ